MTWIDRKGVMDTSGGRLNMDHRNGRTTRKPPAQAEKVYSVAEASRILSVDKRTFMKWLSIDEEDDGPIPFDGWFKLPNGYIRIREWAVMRLQNGEI
jgi:hypothetical protein